MAAPSRLFHVDPVEPEGSAILLDEVSEGPDEARRRRGAEAHLSAVCEIVGLAFPEHCRDERHHALVADVAGRSEGNPVRGAAGPVGPAGGLSETEQVPWSERSGEGASRAGRQRFDP